MSFVIQKRIIHAPHLKSKEPLVNDPGTRVSVTQSIVLFEPTALEMATNFAGAMMRWAKAGFKTVSAEEAAARSNVCRACAFWDGNARFGLGKCKAAGCGCTSIKFWLASEKCPKDKWPDRGQFTKE